MSLNRATIIGNTGKDPVILTSESGNKFGSVTVATTESYKDQSGERKEITDWVNIEFSGPVTEIFEKFVKKGSKIYVEGKIKTRKYNVDGQDRFTTYVKTSRMILLGGKSDDNTIPAVPEVATDDLPF